MPHESKPKGLCCVMPCAGPCLQINANFAMQGRKRPDDFRGGE